MKYFYNVETGQYDDMDAVRNAYNMYAHEYESFENFLSACMTINNGALQDLTTRYNTVADMLRRTDDDDTESKKAYTEELNLITAMMKGE